MAACSEARTNDSRSDTALAAAREEVRRKAHGRHSGREVVAVRRTRAFRQGGLRARHDPRTATAARSPAGRRRSGVSSPPSLRPRRRAGPHALGLGIGPRARAFVWPMCTEAVDPLLEAAGQTTIGIGRCLIALPNSRRGPCRCPPSRRLLRTPNVGAARRTGDGPATIPIKSLKQTVIKMERERCVDTNAKGHTRSAPQLCLRIGDYFSGTASRSRPNLKLRRAVTVWIGSGSTRTT